MEYFAGTITRKPMNTSNLPKNRGGGGYPS
jgi:hypothetical protein